MHLNSAGFCSVGRVLQVPFQLAHSWVPKAGELVENKNYKKTKSTKRGGHPGDGRALHLHSKKQWQIRVWLAVDRDRNEVISHYVGNGTLGAAQELFDQVRHHSISIAATDGNYSYDKVVPPDIRYITDKAETCLVEAKNSSLRGMLAQLNR